MERVTSVLQKPESFCRGTFWGWARGTLEFSSWDCGFWGWVRESTTTGLMWLLRIPAADRDRKGGPEHRKMGEEA